LQRRQRNERNRRRYPVVLPIASEILALVCIREMKRSIDVLWRSRIDLADRSSKPCRVGNLLHNIFPTVLRNLPEDLTQHYFRLPAIGPVKMAFKRTSQVEFPFDLECLALHEWWISRSH